MHVYTYIFVLWETYIHKYILKSSIKRKEKIKYDVNFIHEDVIIFELCWSDENKLKFELNSIAWFIYDKKKYSSVHLNPKSFNFP